MRIPFVGGKKDGGDPERTRLSVPEGQLPQPIPGPWTLKAMVRGTPSPADAAPDPAAEPASASNAEADFAAEPPQPTAPSEADAS